ncbi:ATP-binding protein [Photobacterium phosphoreum]|uniref:ATP-binding protein n=1 Tax=Photobacterium phosphoreum TaxID=659 RepID=UPI0024328065|nr:ATP-binding protein [Photobacterium phosphoreum]
MNLVFHGTTKDRSGVDKVFSNLMDDSQNYSLVAVILTSISELLDNVYQHAVMSVSKDVNWKLEIESKSSEIHISVVDDGCGIPSNISQKYQEELDDSFAIKLAIGYSTGNGRGLGLFSIQSRVQNKQFENIEISSLHGRYRFSSQGEETLSSAAFVQGTEVRFVLREDSTK